MGQFRDESDDPFVAGTISGPEDAYLPTSEDWLDYERYMHETQREPLRRAMREVAVLAGGFAREYAMCLKSTRDDDVKYASRAKAISVAYGQAALIIKRKLQDVP